MFTETSSRGFARRVLRSPLLSVLTGPHGIDSYTELVDRAWTEREARATIAGVRRQTRRSVTLVLQPNQLGAQSFAEFRAGQHITVTVEIDGRRHTRCYSPANAEGSSTIELTIGRHDGGRVSTYLYDHARVGMVVGIGAPAGDFTLGSERRVLFISGGSGITPVLSMLRTRATRGLDGEVAFVHYARNPADATYVEELAAMRGVRVLHGYTRSDVGGLDGRVSAEHLQSALDAPDAVYVCGPPALMQSVHAMYPQARSESFAPPTLGSAGESSGGRVLFADSAVTVTDDGRSLLEQAEAAGLSPESGCRMGICHSCTRRKTSGAVKNLITGAVSSAADEDVQICVSAPAGDVEITL
ncbi:MAG TPA: iron-sulfur cluster-binding domain-containing protein [Mycobacterium sp.]|nr:iron-sulfur cluster-binding domain-containing protein [Mycobacterium sp.]